MSRKAFFIFALLLILPSCIREIPYEYTEGEEALYIVGQLSNTDTTHLFYMGISRGSELIAPSLDSRVECIEDGTLVAITDSVWYDNNTPCFQVLRMPSVVKPGHQYRFDFYSGAYHASAIVDSEPLYNNGIVLDTVSKYDYGQFGAKYYESFIVTFQDCVGKRNYYRVSDRLKGTISYWKMPDSFPSYTFSSDNIGRLRDDNHLFDNGEQPLSSNVAQFFGENTERQNSLRLFTDYSFQDKSFCVSYDCSETRLVIGTWEYFENTDAYDYYTINAELSLMTFPEDEYRYLYLSSMASAAGDDTLNGPVILPDNIENGSGFIGIVTETIITIDLGKRIKKD